MKVDRTLLVGHNLDERTHFPGAVFINMRGVTKTSVSYAALITGKPIPVLTMAWTSKYASLTFNAFGRDFPDDGMNEAGLFIGKIILFMLPSLIAAIWVHAYLPHIAALPEGIRFIQPMGNFLLFLGLILWATAVVQLIAGFSKGKLVINGAYGIVRNTIYSSVTFFILPAIVLMMLTWVYWFH